MATLNNNRKITSNQFERALPNEEKIIKISNCEEAFDIITNLSVRGAPCIAAVACLSLISELNSKNVNNEFKNIHNLIDKIQNLAAYLKTTRPTAVNLRNALDRILDYSSKLASNSESSVSAVISDLTSYCVDAIDTGLELNKQLASVGVDVILNEIPKPQNHKYRILTHCNTGSLATVGHGTALGVIRSLHQLNLLDICFCTETRPINQGSRLTSWELIRDNIPCRLITDSMCSYLFATEKIDAVIVGADCVTLNGDTANKIGTLQIAIAAKHYGVKFYVAVPIQTIDKSKTEGSQIRIEFRPEVELRQISGTPTAPNDMKTWNPAFDITPSNLISGIITEFGSCLPNKIQELLDSENLKNSKHKALY